MSHHNTQNNEQDTLNESEQREAAAWADSEDESMEELIDSSHLSREHEQSLSTDGACAEDNMPSESNGTTDNYVPNSKVNRFLCDDAVISSQQNVFQPNGVSDLVIV